MARFSALVCAAFLLAFLLATPQVESAVSCGTVASAISPCVSYITNKGPLGGCCAGVKKLSAAASSPADRRTACGCLKSLSGKVSGLNLGKAAGLPKTCGVSVPYAISPTTDCSRVS